MRALLNAMAATAQQTSAGASGTRQGIITAYDPDSYAVKVQLQPTGEETGWMQLSSPWVGSGWGLAAGPMVGAEVKVEFDSGLMGAGMASGQFYNDEDRCPGPPSGEFWLIHKSGSLLKFLNSGDVLLNSATKITYSAPAHHFTGGDVLIEENLTVVKNVNDQKGIYGSLHRLRTTYNGHRHFENGQGSFTQLPVDQVKPVISEN
ncbi:MULTISPECIES: phage baseplate assembly protein V [unclassified Pantoea]|uniref:phage baseplate assembly protein V n=1 Tax=unclassified Pantoea TaxID=2630326 RepID=UPI001CD734B3|nr:MULTISPECIES: phage baseplate assembly protein V [unclassified Pantoea]MCA1179777.1 phage baseplate assembly protein V [Pantoea sp. alder69]MCA1253621.1 phage baseplate assembly protein V [Pantoea sp. alder70]MCA1268263.1 phage baseplate assembly protein V [Pantoea sp. alder81]